MLGGAFNMFGDHDYVLAVRTMLDAHIVIEPVLCGGCGRHIVDAREPNGGRDID